MGNRVRESRGCNQSAIESVERIVQKAREVKRERLNTSFFFPFQDIEHADVLTVGFNVDGVERVLDLRLNADLIPVGYQERHQHRGAYKVHTPSKVVSTRLGLYGFISRRYAPSRHAAARVNTAAFPQNDLAGYNRYPGGNLSVVPDRA